MNENETKFILYKLYVMIIAFKQKSPKIDCFQLSVNNNQINFF